MGKASRAIITRGNDILLMRRNKNGNEYFTLVGGRVNGDETTEQALVREIKEETGLDVTSYRLVFVEENTEPYNSQYIYLCEVAPFENVAIGENSEEGMMNKMDINVHTPVWAMIKTLPMIHFRTPALVNALIDGFKNGFPESPKKL